MMCLSEESANILCQMKEECKILMLITESKFAFILRLQLLY